MAEPTPKRRLTEDDSDPNTGSTNVNWPKFILLESTSTETPLSKLSPFAIHKGILGVAGTVKDVKKLRSGQILVECTRKIQADNLLGIKTFVGVSIKTFPHPVLNSCKGVIRCRELDDISEEEIVTELAPQGVTAVKRITIRKRDETIKTNTYILTFDKPTLPDKISVGYLKVNVELYIPNPIRCYKCQKYGHGSVICKSPAICYNCGEEDHVAPCLKPPKCRNCGGPHPASDKTCPNWIKEKEIQKIRCSKKVSHEEARKLVNDSPNFKFVKPFSAVVKATRTNSCQTEITWLTSDKPQLVTNPKEPTPPKVKSSYSQSPPMTAQTLPHHKQNQPTASHSGGITRKKMEHSRQQQKASTDLNTGQSEQLKDIEMEEGASSRSRSASPKGRSRSHIRSSRKK